MEWNFKHYKDLAKTMLSCFFQDCMCCQCLCNNLPLSLSSQVFLYMLTFVSGESRRFPCLCKYHLKVPRCFSLDVLNQKKVLKVKKYILHGTELYCCCLEFGRMCTRFWCIYFLSWIFIASHIRAQFIL